MRRRGNHAFRCQGHASVCIFVTLLASVFVSVSAAVPKENGGNETTAAAAFELTRLLPQENGVLKTEVFFAKGQAVCADGAKESACHADGKYSDRVAFRFKYDAYNNASNITVPHVTVKEKGVLAAKMKEWEHVEEDGSGSFSLVYNCLKPKATATLTLSMEITAGHAAAKVTWTKTCGGGKNEHLTISSDDLVAKSPGLLPEAGPMQVSTDIEMKSGFPQVSLDFGKPVLVSKNPDIGVKLRVTLNKDTLSVSPKQFIVIYDCKTKTRGVVSLTVPIPPWHDAALSWTKDCGGGHPDKLLVELGDQVVVNGTGVAPAFNISETTTLRSAVDANIHNLDVTQSKLDFVITNKDSVAYHIQGATTTVLNPDILAVVSRSDWGSFGKSYLTGDKEFVLQPLAFVHMKIDMVCLAKGSAVVLVTLPVLQYRNVEFGFYKDCERPHVFHHSGFLRTASSLELLLAVVLVVAAIVGYRVYRRRREQGGGKYEQVSAAAA